MIRSPKTYQVLYTATWNVLANDPKLSLYFHNVENLIDVRCSCQFLENLSLVNELFDAFVPEFRVGSDVHGIRVDDLDGKLLLGDFMNSMKNLLAEAYARPSNYWRT